jgi:Glycosyl hydrolases family 25
MAIFGADISSYQRGLDLSRLSQSSFVIAKITEGTYYTDDCYDGWRQQAANVGELFAWYHFLSGQSAAVQVAHTLANVGDEMLPGMLDAEPAGDFKPTWTQILAYIDAAHAAGLNLRLLYLPRWYWDQIGRPDLTVLTPRRVYLVSSAYPGGTGGPAALYPGDGAAGWQPYGGVTPLLYQFTDQASDGGQPLDYSAFRGGVDQLRAYLQADGATDPVPVPSPPAPTSVEDDDMPAFATGEIKPGEGVVTIVLPPPANLGAAGWGDVWFSLGSNFGTAHVHVVAHVHGQRWSRDFPDVVVRDGDDRVNPFGGPLPTGVQKISITRTVNPDVPLSYLIEAAHR